MKTDKKKLVVRIFCIALSALMIISTVYTALYFLIN